MPHNHEPWCCCPLAPPAAKVCPSCPEHGELATLSKPHAIAYNPADEDPIAELGERLIADEIRRERDTEDCNGE